MLIDSSLGTPDIVRDGIESVLIQALWYSHNTPCDFIRDARDWRRVLRWGVAGVEPDYRREYSEMIERDMDLLEEMALSRCGTVVSN